VELFSINPKNHPSDGQLAMKIQKMEPLVGFEPTTCSLRNGYFMRNSLILNGHFPSILSIPRIPINF
jgi:hypothetical protein